MQLSKTKPGSAIHRLLGSEARLFTRQPPTSPGSRLPLTSGIPALMSTFLCRDHISGIIVRQGHSGPLWWLVSEVQNHYQSSLCLWKTWHCAEIVDVRRMLHWTRMFGVWLWVIPWRLRCIMKFLLNKAGACVVIVGMISLSQGASKNVCAQITDMETLLPSF